MTESQKRYAISEIFTSPQGEGLFSGTLMTFVRLAGCSVGKKIGPGVLGLPVYTEECTTWDGRKFLCDTDFRPKETLTAEEILARVPEGVRHVCITGGEPMTRELVPLFEAIYDKHPRYADQSMVHLETSGTIFKPDVFSWMGRGGYRPALWITVSPKFGALPECIKSADEIKLLVDEQFDLEKAKQLVGEHELVFLQPVNDEHSLIQANVERCLNVQKQMPSWRLSLQLHKVMGVR